MVVFFNRCLVLCNHIYQSYGVEEIVTNSIDRDGMQNFYNLQMVHKVKDFMNVPSAFLGDA